MRTRWNRFQFQPLSEISCEGVATERVSTDVEMKGSCRASHANDGIHTVNLVEIMSNHDYNKKDSACIGSSHLGKYSWSKCTAISGAEADVNASWWK